jgi:hypothetical protein
MRRHDKKRHIEQLNKRLNESYGQEQISSPSQEEVDNEIKTFTEGELTESNVDTYQYALKQIGTDQINLVATGKDDSKEISGKVETIDYHSGSNGKPFMKITYDAPFTNDMTGEVTPNRAELVVFYDGKGYTGKIAGKFYTIEPKDDVTNKWLYYVNAENGKHHRGIEKDYLDRLRGTTTFKLSDGSEITGQVSFKMQGQTPVITVDVPNSNEMYYIYCEGDANDYRLTYKVAGKREGENIIQPDPSNEYLLKDLGEKHFNGTVGESDNERSGIRGLSELYDEMVEDNHSSYDDIKRQHGNDPRFLDKEYRTHHDDSIEGIGGPDRSRRSMHEDEVEYVRPDWRELGYDSKEEFEADYLEHIKAGIDSKYWSELEENEHKVVNEGTKTMFEKLCGVKLIKEEIYDLKRDIENGIGRGFSQQDAENYLGRPLSDYEVSGLFGGGRYQDEYRPKPKPSYENNLKSQSSKFEITKVEAKTAKATLVYVKELASETTKKMWVPNSQIKDGVVAAWVIKKNF